MNCLHSYHGENGCSPRPPELHRLRRRFQSSATSTSSQTCPTTVCPTSPSNSAPLSISAWAKTHDHVFASRPPLTAAQHLSFGCSDVTFSPHGPYWRQARKICVTELLSPKRVTSFQLIQNEETHHLLTSLSALSGSETDMSQLFFTLANNDLYRVAFGKRFMDDSEGEKKHMVDVLTETQALFAGFCIGDFFLDWKWLNSITGLN